MYKMTSKDTILHQYLVTFEPEVLPKLVFDKFMAMVSKGGFSEPFAFDGAKMLVSNKKFGDTTLSMGTKCGEQKCHIVYKNSYDSADRNSHSVSTLIQCMETVYRFHQRQRFYVERKRMISPSSTPMDLGAGICTIPGLSSSLKLTSNGFYLNLDLAFGVFYKSDLLLDVLTDVAKNNRRYCGNPLVDDLGAEFYADFEKMIRSMRLTTIHRERNATLKVSGILCKPASSVEFEVDGKTMTVADYFAKTYKPLKYPHLPLVVVKKRDMNIYVPMEVLSVTPMQKYPKRLNEHATSAMIKIAAKRPFDRFKMIEEKARELSAIQNETLRQFGMVFDGKMMGCKGTILPPPGVAFAANRGVDVNNGSWNLIGVSAVRGVVVGEWTIFAFRKSDIPTSLAAFKDLSLKYGVEFSSNPKSVCVRNVKEFFDANKSKFNLVVLPDKNAQRYEEIKRIAETYHACYTQCIQASNLSKLSNPSFVSNLLLKINCKLGGKNWNLKRPVLADKPTILIGIDINHPGIADLESPSIVSVVASMDYEFVNYRTVVEQQGRREEIVGNLKNIVKSLLKAHYSCTKMKPTRIIVFRDGVGDSMFDAVFNCEIDAVRGACQDLEASYKPELNFIVAQKRHSVRFSCQGRNPQPGTVVDTIGHPGCFDFYLVSHNAIQGTARPVRYLVLLNESKFGRESLYEFVYSLCHLYARATKSVSIVPPVYYAHLAAARGKCYLEKNSAGVCVMRECDPTIQKTLYYL